jgi:hypothetical protein
VKCLYYLAPTLESARTVSDDLHSVGIKDWYIHVISNDEAGLKKERIHSSNYIETLDFIRTGLLGAYIGFFVGMFGALLLMATQTFGANAPISAYLAFMIIATLFGAWVGGMYGVGVENKKLSQFHTDIQSGKYLFLIYSRKGSGKTIKTMMREKHPESELVAIDQHFLSPFGEINRTATWFRPASFKTQKSPSKALF